jgi:sporulation protein YlmC with PRC-barrel domain
MASSDRGFMVAWVYRAWLNPGRRLKKVYLAAADRKEPVDPHLRSTGDVTGYRIHAADGEIGDVEDFIIDDQTWNVHFLVVDTGHWFPGKKVLISPRWISKIKWEAASVDDCHYGKCGQKQPGI